ncbi:STAS domain-containing protein [Streptomyces sp. NPDC057074]|uniref:STAS domain-containing protein n=1 Tax=Streptomyces sp. NPDC057074 TaxID=3346015 RepID=UPI003636B9AE
MEVVGKAEWRQRTVFSVDVRPYERGVVFALRGELDFDSVVQLHEATERELSRMEGPPVVVDCARLAFCDSSGIGGLLRLSQRLSAQDRVLRLAAVPASVARLLALTGLDRLFTVHADVHEALGAGTDRHDTVAAAEGPAGSTDEGRRT